MEQSQQWYILRSKTYDMIEGFVGRMTSQILRDIRVKSKQELAERIYKYFDEVNETSVVFHWRYKMDEFELSAIQKKTI